MEIVIYEEGWLWGWERTSSEWLADDRIEIELQNDAFAYKMQIHTIVLILTWLEKDVYKMLHGAVF